MLQIANISTSDFFFKTEWKKHVHDLEKLEHDIQNFSDLITIRLMHYSVEHVIASLIPEAFNLRLRIIGSLSRGQEILQSIFEAGNEVIANDIQLGAYSDLAVKRAEFLALFQKISLGIFETIGVHSETDLTEIHTANLSYEITKTFSGHPDPRVAYLKNWFDASISFEIAMIISGMILWEDFQVIGKKTEDLEKEVLRAIKDSVIRYGGLAIFVGFWKPPLDEYSVLQNSMQILAAKYEAETALTSVLKTFQTINAGDKTYRLSAPLICAVERDGDGVIIESKMVDVVGAGATVGEAVVDFSTEFDHLFTKLQGLGPEQLSSKMQKTKDFFEVLVESID